jgi:parvulin-like peptidyl-prolyl isomerase
METKLKIFPIILLLSLNLFSQTDTSKVCIPYPIAQKIAIELIQKDSIQAELTLTQQILQEVENKSSIQDSIIITYQEKDSLCKEQIIIFENKEEVYKGRIKELEEENKKLILILKWTGGAIVGIIVTSLAIITAK